jgi:thiol-disulfide isomerase/thioredoxin
MRARWILPAVLTAVLVAAGCGSDDSSASDDAGSTAGAGTTGEEPDEGTEGDEGGEGDTGSGTADGDPATVSETLSFTGTTVDGEPFDAAELAGKPTVLWFWAPWCPKCRAQGPETANVAAQFEGQAHVVGVAGLDTTEAMKDFVDSAGVASFPNLSDESGDIWKKFQITEQSIYVVLDKDGEEVFTGNLPAGEGLADKVAELVG